MSQRSPQEIRCERSTKDVTQLISMLTALIPLTGRWGRRRRWASRERWGRTWFIVRKNVEEGSRVNIRCCCWSSLTWQQRRWWGRRRRRSKQLLLSITVMMSPRVRGMKSSLENCSYVCISRLNQRRDDQCISHDVCQGIQQIDWMLDWTRPVCVLVNQCQEDYLKKRGYKGLSGFVLSRQEHDLIQRENDWLDIQK